MLNKILVIYQKEMISYFKSPIAYFLLSVFLIGTGYFFLYNIFMTGTAEMDTTLQNMGILFIVLAPVLTMRIFSNEYSTKTIEILLTLPISVFEIVIGKFFAIYSLFLIMTFASMINLIPMFLYGNPDVKNIISGYLGFILLGLAAISMGQFFSSLTKNQIIAALMTFVTLLGVWMIEHIQIFQNEYFLKELVGILSFSNKYGDFITGLIRTDSIFFFIITSIIFLNLNVFVLRWNR